jgi:hypothetical protein
MAQQLAVIEDANFSFDPEISDEERRQAQLEKMAGVVASLTSKFVDNKSLRSPVETRWLEDLRQFHGMYEEKVEGALKADPERSKVFINLTRPKTTAWEARLWDLLFPADGKNWGVKETPVPELAENMKRGESLVEQHEPRMMQLVDEHNSMVDGGADQAAIQPVREEIDALAYALQRVKAFMTEAQKTLDVAQRCAALMEREIEDQLVEFNYSAVSRDVIADACKLGVGIMKGPVTTNKPRRKWEQNEQAGTYMLAGQGNPRPLGRRVDPWHFFPDMEAQCPDDLEFVFERHLKNRSQFVRMSRELGFEEKAVAAILKEGPQNDIVSDLNYLVQLQALSDDYLGAAVKNKFIIIEYHGPLSDEDLALMLRGLGQDEAAEAIEMDGMDPFAERDVVAYFCQGRMLKIAPDYPMDSGEKLYSVFSFERGEAGILDAKGVPRLMRSEQAMLNSAVRMVIDNGALSAGPQIVVDKSKVEPENGNWKMAPRKVWIKKGEDLGTDKAFEVFNIPVNTQQLVGIVELAMKLIDDVITMPMIAQGEQGQATGTLGGMSMLFNSANVVFRRVVKNWDDDITAPVIRRFYDWNMQFNEKDAIKGDMQCEARGTSVLLVREIQSQQLMAIAMQWSTHPVIGPAVRVYESLRLTLQALAINPGDVLVGEDEFEKRLKALAESEPQTPEAIRAQAQLQVATIGAESKMQQLGVEREIAEMNLQVEVMKLVQKEGVDMASVQALLATTKMKVDSEERKLAVETAVEVENAKAARAAGQQPTGSGGSLSLGSKPK